MLQGTLQAALRGTLAGDFENDTGTLIGALSIDSSGLSGVLENGEDDDPSMTCSTCDGERDVFELYQGESRHWVLVVTDAETGDPVDITGYKIYMTVRARQEDVADLWHARTANASGGADTQIKIRTPATGTDIGKADVYTIPANTSNLRPGTYWTDVWLVAPTGSPAPQTLVVAPHELKVKQSITRLFP